MIKLILPKKHEEEKAMHVEQFLHNILSAVMHLKRLTTLKALVITVLLNKKLSVTGLGRTMGGKALERSNIRRSDRFIGNLKLYEERDGIYTVIARLVVGDKKRPWIIVDWSQVPNTNNYVLRAALVATGRALTIYEEVHPKKKENNHGVHKKFLTKLKKLLPTECRPILITDAGFHNPWFKAVQKLNWDYLGRVRGKKCYRILGEKGWNYCKDLFKKANSVGKYIGEVELCREGSLRTHFYLIKQKKQGRVRLNKLGKKGNHKKDKAYSASANEPWLLATSLGKGYSVAKRIFKIYFSRMQIEEGFRDLKSSKYGFSLEEAHSKDIARIEILLLIAMLASLIAWLTGWIGEKMQWQYQFQANSIKSKRILSLFFLGCQIIRKRLKIPIDKLLEAVEAIKGYSVCPT